MLRVVWMLQVRFSSVLTHMLCSAPLGFFPPQTRTTHVREGTGGLSKRADATEARGGTGGRIGPPEQGFSWFHRLDGAVL